MAQHRRTPSTVTVIIPVGSLDHLDEQLGALSRQAVDAQWDVVCGDNIGQRTAIEMALARAGLADHSAVVDATAALGAGAVRNEAARHASGELLAFCDADDVVDDGWLDALVSVAPDHDILAGWLDGSMINSPDVAGWRPTRPRHRPVGGFLPIASSGNFAVWRSVFEAVGGFDAGYLRSQDVRVLLAKPVEGLLPRVRSRRRRALPVSEFRGCSPAPGLQERTGGRQAPPGFPSSRTPRSFGRRGARRPGLAALTRPARLRVSTTSRRVATPAWRGRWPRCRFAAPPYDVPVIAVSHRLIRDLVDR
ncbi:glycosyltransferase family 2 protein [Actinospongicola halichondriae]|uniref:glycosyltransferase family 2 protein n=1 Tax=Actinospongicola halichondriae TaxID=3236844 RepID=UPI003D564667